MYDDNVASNVSGTSPNAKNNNTNGNLNSSDGIANAENEMTVGLDFARSTCNASESISKNSGGFNENDSAPINCNVFLRQKTSLKLIKIKVEIKRKDIFKKTDLIIFNSWHRMEKPKKLFTKFVLF